MSSEVWTLVQHSGHVRGAHTEFEHGLESAQVMSRREAARIREAGGWLFDSYGDAEIAAFDLQYPPGHLGMIPVFAGGFIPPMSGHDLPVAVPNKENG